MRQCFEPFALANLAGSMPQGKVDAGTFGITFYAGRPDVTYIVETSDDLTPGSWTSTGVTLTPPDGDGMVTGSVPLGAGSKFLRLKLTR